MKNLRTDTVLKAPKHPNKLQFVLVRPELHRKIKFIAFQQRKYIVELADEALNIGLDVILSRMDERKRQLIHESLVEEAKKIEGEVKLKQGRPDGPLAAVQKVFAKYTREKDEIPKETDSD